MQLLEVPRPIRINLGLLKTCRSQYVLSIIRSPFFRTVVISSINMARTFDALIALLALYSSLANAALYGRNETTVAGSGTIGTGGITSLTTFSTSSTLSRSSTSLTLTLTPKSSTNTTAQGTSSTTSSSTTTTLVGTGGKTTSSTSSTSAKSITSSGGTGIGTGPTTGGTTSTSSSSSSSNSITLIPTTISSGSIIETSTITSTLSHSGTTTTSSSQTSTATGFPIVTNGQCKGPDCNNGACTGILCISLGCSGSGCANGICTGLDCISLGCIGGGCSNGVCIGSCVTSGCEGSDCDTTTGECSGSDCISVGCSGPDCDSSTGSCSGPNCSTETCSGTDCDKGSCTGSGCDDEGTQTGGGTDAPTDNPTSPTSSTLSSTSSSSSSCSTETATLCAAACSVVAVPDASNTTTTLSTSCYTTACSATAACSVEDTTTSSLTTLTSTPSGACMTVIPFSAIASPGSVVSTSYSATAITYTIATVTANSTSSTGTGTNSGNTVTSSAITTSSSSSITSASASTVACTYQGADPDQGIDGYCICSSSTYSMLTGTSGNLCAYTALPTSTAVITASPLYTTTQNCYVCTVYGEANEDCLLMSGCTPTSTTTVATTSASTTTTTSPRVTCTLWTDCPPCPSGESEICAGTGGQETCGCITESSKFRLRRDYEPKARRKDYRLSRPDRPLARRADDDGDALSCPYEPPAEDTYCTATGLSKRANAAKELNLPWVSGMKWSNYPQCPNTGNAGITQVPQVSPTICYALSSDLCRLQHAYALLISLQFYYPAGASPLQNGIQSYDPTSAQDASTNGLIAGIAQSQFANDHVFEAQLVSGFLSWLCGQPSITSYTQIPWPAGWTQPDTQWCAAVFGSDAGKLSPGMGHCCNNIFEKSFFC